MADGNIQIHSLVDIFPGLTPRDEAALGAMIGSRYTIFGQALRHCLREWEKAARQSPPDEKTVRRMRTQLGNMQRAFCMVTGLRSGSDIATHPSSDLVEQMAYRIYPVMESLCDMKFQPEGDLTLPDGETAHRPESIKLWKAEILRMIPVIDRTLQADYDSLPVNPMPEPEPQFPAQPPALLSVNDFCNRIKLLPDHVRDILVARLDIEPSGLRDARSAISAAIRAEKAKAPDLERMTELHVAHNKVEFGYAGLLTACYRYQHGSLGYSAVDKQLHELAQAVRDTSDVLNQHFLLSETDKTALRDSICGILDAHEQSNRSADTAEIVPVSVMERLRMEKALHDCRTEYAAKRAGFGEKYLSGRAGSSGERSASV